MCVEVAWFQQVENGANMQLLLAFCRAGASIMMGQGMHMKGFGKRVQGRAVVSKHTCLSLTTAVMSMMVTGSWTTGVLFVTYSYMLIQLHAHTAVCS